MTILSRILFAALIAVFPFSLPARPQAGQPIQTLASQSTTVPDFALYDAFFFRVVWIEGQASKLALQGKDGSRIGSTIQRETGITAQEYMTLKAIAADSRAKVAAILAKEQALRSASASRSDPQLRDLVNQRKQTVLDHLQSLKEALGNRQF